MFGLALAPSLSHAMALAQGGQTSWTEICTPTGMSVVAVASPTDDKPGAPTGSLSVEHCPYCAHGNALTTLLPAPIAVFAVPLAAAAPPPLFLHAPRTLFAWAAAQPRAPPALS